MTLFNFLKHTNLDIWFRLHWQEDQQSQIIHKIAQPTRSIVLTRSVLDCNRFRRDFGPVHFLECLSQLGNFRNFGSFSHFGNFNNRTLFLPQSDILIALICRSEKCYVSANSSFFLCFPYKFLDWKFYFCSATGWCVFFCSSSFWTMVDLNLGTVKSRYFYHNFALF